MHYTRKNRKLTVGRKARSTAAGSSLLRAARELHHVIKNGDLIGTVVRHVEIPEPPMFTAADVKALRELMKVSVAVFAELLAVTTAEVVNWEQGRRTPAPTIRRLMELIKIDPLGFVNSFVKHTTLHSSTERS